MIYFFWLMVFVICSIAFWLLGYDKGHRKAKSDHDIWLKELKEIPLPGRVVTIDGFGAVTILGSEYSEDGDFIHYIPTSILQGRLPSKLSTEELDQHTIRVPLEQFLVQCEEALKYAT